MRPFTKKRFVNQLINNRAVSLLVLTLVIIVIMAAIYPHQFFTFDNFSGILLNLSLEAICAVGMMFLIVSGVFDLSIGANYTLAGAVTAILLKMGEGGILFSNQAFVPIPMAILAGVAVSVLAGLINGILVARVGVNALIATLAMMFILRGIAIILAGSGLVIDQYTSYVVIGQAVFLGLQAPIYYMIIIVILGMFLLSKTRFFRQFYFIGGNKKSAELSGINVTRTLIINFVIMGFLAGLAGVVFAARMNKGSGIYANSLNLNVITAVIIGGGRLSVGKGTVAGAFMGVFFLHIVKNLMIIIGINPYIQPIVTGIILMAAVALDVIIQRRYGRTGVVVRRTQLNTAGTKSGKI